jgi:phasin
MRAPATPRLVRSSASGIKGAGLSEFVRRTKMLQCSINRVIERLFFETNTRAPIERRGVPPGARSWHRNLNSQIRSKIMAIAKKPVTKTVEETITAGITEPVAAMKEAAAEAMKPFADIQEQVRAKAEKSLETIRTQYATMKTNAELATDKLEESIAAAHAGTREFNTKVFDLFRTNSNAAFDHMQKLFATKSVADAVKLQQDFAKTQFETAQVHSKELAEMAKKLAMDVVEPVKASVVLPFKG